MSLLKKLAARAAAARQAAFGDSKFLPALYLAGAGALFVYFRPGITERFSRWFADGQALVPYSALDLTARAAAAVGAIAVFAVMACLRARSRRRLQELEAEQESPEKK